MWKESYKLGVERIDFQHKALFEKTQELLEAIKHDADAHTFEQAIFFLKGYVISHFRDEEKYQESIGYKDINQHKKAHASFTRWVTGYEHRLAKEGFHMALMKDLAGTLTTWLTYHVANTDLKMVKGISIAEDDRDVPYIQLFSSSVEETLQSVAGLGPDTIREYDAASANLTGDVQVDIDVFGEVNGTLSYTYTREVALNLFESMTAHRPSDIDQLVGSCLQEITNIATGNATVKLARRGISSDISPPVVHILQSDGDNSIDGVVLDTGIGQLKMSAALDRYS